MVIYILIYSFRALFEIASIIYIISLIKLNIQYIMNLTPIPSASNTLTLLSLTFFLKCQLSRAENNLLNEYMSLGIYSKRISLTWKFTKQDYIPVKSLADLSLDNFLYNAHTTATDILWSGVPLLTLPGRHMVSRAGVSLLNSVGTSQSITSSTKVNTIQRERGGGRERNSFVEMVFNCC